MMLAFAHCQLHTCMLLGCFGRGLAFERGLLTRGTLLFLERAIHRPKLVDAPLPRAVLVEHRRALLCRQFGSCFCDVRAEVLVQLSDARACIAVLVSAIKLFIDVDVSGEIGFDANGCLRLNEVNAQCVQRGLSFAAQSVGRGRRLQARTRCFVFCFVADARFLQRVCGVTRLIV